MSDGQCGARTYDGFNQAKIDAVIAKLRESGATVSGANQWNVETGKHGVNLQGTWDGTAKLTVIVTDKNFYVPCSKVWDTLDGILTHIGELQSVA